MLDFDLVDKIKQKGKPWWYQGVRDENWGGKRKGAGRPKVKIGMGVMIDPNPIQVKLLMEYGDGDLNKGLMKLINENF
jgi:hypothetical protein